MATGGEFLRLSDDRLLDRGDRLLDRGDRLSRYGVPFRGSRRDRSSPRTNNIVSLVSEQLK